MTWKEVTKQEKSKSPKKEKKIGSQSLVFHADDKIVVWI